MEKYKIILKGIVQYEDKFLLVEKWYDDRIVNPYQWEFIDGKLNFGEAPEQGVLRIVEEASGLITQVNKILYTWSFMVGDVCNLGITFLLLSASDYIALSEDFHEARWVTKEEFDRFIENRAILGDINKSEL